MTRRNIKSNGIARMAKPSYEYYHFFYEFHEIAYLTVTHLKPTLSFNLNFKVRSSRREQRIGTMRLLLHLSVATLLFLGFASAGRWEDEDTIIIDAFEPEIPPRLKREEQPSPLRDDEDDTVSVRSPRCRTTRGQLGQCVALKECYPILFPINPDMKLSNGTMNDALAHQLIAASGFCGGGEYRSDSPSLFAQVVRADVLVCCALQSRTPSPLPPSPPSPPAQMNDTVPARSGCGTIKIDPSSLPQFQISPNNSDPVNPDEGRIVNGREAKRGEFPWIVALMNKGREFCGGSLIDTQTVLTAAHCVQHMKPEDVQRLTIQIGDHDIYSTADGRHEVRTASRILYHKDFSMNHLHHDVALIRLNTPISPSTYIQVVCMHSGSPSYDNVYGDVSGWGQLRDNGPQPSKLQTANVKIWSHEDCKQRYDGVAPAGIGQGMVCAGGDGKDSCRGDSGGPLTTDSRTRAQQVGIVSFGVGCGSYPGVYTRVDKYTAWINKNRRRTFTD